MKKLMIAAVMVCAAAFAQAATVSWMSGNMTLPSGDAAGSSVKMSVFLLDDAEVFAGLTADSIIANYKDATPDLSGNTSKSKKTLAKDGYDTGDNVYAAILFSYTDEDGKTQYIANKAQATIAESLGEAQDASITTLATVFGGEGDAVNFGEGFGGSTADWGTGAAVPEPTSALLMLLGVAGLALKRKRA